MVTGTAPEQAGPLSFRTDAAGTVFVASVVGLTWTAVAFGQQPGFTGVFDAAAFADRSMAGVEWWGWPIVDGAVAVLLVLGAIDGAVRRLADRPGWQISLAAVVARLGWAAAFVVTLSIAIRSGPVLAIGAHGADRLSGIVALLVTGACWVLEATVASRHAPPRPPRPGHPRIAGGLAVDPRRGVLAAATVLVAGGAGAGFTAALSGRLLIELAVMVWAALGQRGLPSERREAS